MNASLGACGCAGAWFLACTKHMSRSTFDMNFRTGDRQQTVAAIAILIDEIRGAASTLLEASSFSIETAG